MVGKRKYPEAMILLLVFLTDVTHQQREPMKPAEATAFHEKPVSKFIRPICIIPPMTDQLFTHNYPQYPKNLKLPPTSDQGLIKVNDRFRPLTFLPAS